MVIEDIVKGLNVGQEEDITGLVNPASDILEYIDGPQGEEVLVTKIILKVEGHRDPVTMISIYQNGELVEDKFFYQDQQAELEEYIKTFINS